MKCANCDNDALFEYRVTHAKSLFYCGKHLPKFLEERKRAGLLAITEKFKEAEAEALDILFFETVPVVEEPVVVEESKPKPKKKAAKKKAE